MHIDDAFAYARLLGNDADLSRAEPDVKVVWLADIQPTHFAPGGLLEIAIGPDDSDDLRLRLEREGELLIFTREQLNLLALNQVRAQGCHVLVLQREEVGRLEDSGRLQHVDTDGQR